MRQMRIMVLFFLMLLFCSDDVTAADSAGNESSWRPVSWGGGDIFIDIASHPQDFKQVWALSLYGGVLQSDTCGDTWQWANGDLPSLSPVAIVPEPAEPQGAYLVMEQGIWRTGDRGRTWTQVPGTSLFRFKPFASYKPLYISSDGKTLAAGTADGGLFLSRDSGKNWKSPEWGNTKAVRIIAPTAVGGELLIALSEAAGLYRFNVSDNETPRFLSSAPTFPVLDIAVDPVYPNSVYAVCGTHGLWKSGKNAMNWERETFTDVADDESMFFVAFCGDGEERMVTVCCQAFCLRSRNGKDWERFLRDVYYSPSVNPMRKWNSRRMIPTAFRAGATKDILFMTDYCGMYRTLNATGNALWSEVVKGATSQIINDMALDAGGRLFVAADRTGLFVSGGGGGNFQSVWPEAYGKQAGEYAAVACGRGGILLTASLGKWDQHTQVYYGSAEVRKILGRAEGINGKKIILRRHPFTSGPWGLAASMLEQGLAYLVVGSSFPVLYVSRDGGRSWYVESLPDQVCPGKAVAVDRSRKGWVYLGSGTSRTGVWRSRNYGKNWKQVLDTDEGIVDIVVGMGETLYALGARGSVWASSTHGISWKKGGAIEGAGASAICVDAIKDETVYAASGSGAIFVSTDSGATWTKVSDPPQRLPQINCLVKPHEKAGLYVGTSGAGIWYVEF